MFQVFSHYKSDLSVLYEDMVDELSSDQCYCYNTYLAIIEEHLDVVLALFKIGPTAIK